MPRFSSMVMATVMAMATAIAWAIFDMGDAYYDTTVVLPPRWTAAGSNPSNG